MSLINEALKKARHEAARREAMETGQPYPVTPRHLPRRRRGGPLPWILAGALLVALGAGATAWLLSGRTAVQEMPAEPTEPGPEGPAAASPDTAGSPSRDGESRPPADSPADDASRSAAREPRPEPTPDPAPADGAEIAPSPAPSAGGDVGPESLRRDTFGEAAATATETGTRTYKGTARLSDGRTLSLAGVATGDEPVAVVNGRVLGLGEGVEGFILEAVDSGRATLRDGDLIVILELP